MNKRPPRIKKAEYPDETIGSKLASEARKIANSLTDEERAECLEGARALIYGEHGPSKRLASR